MSGGERGHEIRGDFEHVGVDGAHGIGQDGFTASRGLFALYGFVDVGGLFRLETKSAGEFDDQSLFFTREHTVFEHDFNR